MDYNLAAMKLFCSQLKEAQQTDVYSSSTSAISLYGILFQRAWVQGVLVSKSDAAEEGRCMVLDDGTDVVELLVTGDLLNQELKVGMYVMAVGLFIPRADGISQIKAHKIVNLSSYPDRQSMWHLEVIEAYKLFYESPFEG